MTVNHFILSSYFTCFSTILLAIFVALRDPKKKLYKIFFLYSLSIAFWSFSVSWFVPTISFEQADFFSKTLHLGAIMIPVFFVHFIFVLLGETPKTNKQLKVIYFFAFIFQGLNLFTPWLISGVSYREHYAFPTPGATYLAFFLFFVFCVCFGLVKLFFAFIKAKGIIKNQLSYLLIGSIIGYMGGLDNFLITIDLNIFPLYPFGAYGIAFYVLIMAYAIVTTRLLAIEVVIKRGVVYSSVAFVLTTIYFLIAYLSELLISKFTGYRGFLAAFPSIIIIAVMFQPTRDKIQYVVDRKMFKKRYLYQRILGKYSHALTKPTTDTSKLSRIAPYLIVKTMNLMNVSMFIVNRELGRYELRGAERGARSLTGHVIEQNSGMVKCILKERKTIVKDEMKYMLENVPLFPDDKRCLESLLWQMDELDCVLIIPLISESEYFGEPTLLSVFCLGEKVSGEPFSADDISFLEAMAGQATITIEYALILEELERSRQRLVQSEKLAALGTMAAGVAHEIKNPLAALKLFTEVIPQKFDDPDYRNKFAKLIPSELNRLKRILSDLENFSKPDIETKSAPFSVKAVIKKTLQFLELQFKKASVKATADLKDSEKVMGSSSKMMQVFMNIIINAVHAMEGGGKLDVKSETKGDYIYISIADSGSGIPKDKLKEIFNPFFTTKETGTGLGLAISGRIIGEHNGIVTVDSEVGKGSIFTIKLPIIK